MKTGFIFTELVALYSVKCCGAQNVTFTLRVTPPSVEKVALYKLLNTKARSTLRAGAAVQFHRLWAGLLFLLFDCFEVKSGAENISRIDAVEHLHTAYSICGFRLKLLGPQMEVKLAHDGADAVDAGFTAHLGMRYVLRKRF